MHYMLQTAIIFVILRQHTVASERISMGRVEPSHFQKWDSFHVILPIRAVQLFTRIKSLVSLLLISHLNRVVSLFTGDAGQVPAAGPDD